ncbi:nucleoside monophosphate kinase [Patescibacteria group bacterium]|nr:nucleoside monophosphate kinase [Patescibacteria group bacterium]MBZ9578531.1 nucleoside monophosphate kinase [Patescibacteria group bacterium]
MKQQFPIFKTKIEGVSRLFDLSNPKECREYFELKAGAEIRKLRDYLRKNTFIAHLLGKKGSGKGTYSKLFIGIIDPQRANHVSIGDVVRNVHQEILEESKKRELIDWLSENYRGYISIDQAIQALLSRNTETLLPTEFILALVKRKISKIGRKALFIDGFPRGLDQISYSLFFRDLIDYREDPDIFILIDVPEAVIDERMKHRVVCPLCQAPRNLKLFPTKEIGFDKKQGEFYLICDNPDCKGRKMVSKEGDKLGIEPIRERLEMDEKLIKQAFSLYGIPKILLRNSVPIELAKDYVDDYEITPEYNYQWDEKSKKVKIIKKPWIVLDDKGNQSFSLLPQPVAVSLIKQMADVLNL